MRNRVTPDRVVRCDGPQAEDGATIKVKVVAGAANNAPSSRPCEINPAGGLDESLDIAFGQAQQPRGVFVQDLRPVIRG